MTSMLLFPVAVLAGVAGACQGAANGSLFERAGLGTALLFNSVVVLLGSLALFFATGGPRQIAALAGAPWSHYIGGLCGLVIVAAMAVAVPRIGTALVLALMVLGQGSMALAIDHFGMFGMRTIPLTVTRVVGGALLVAGVLLMRR
jgi:transporter family-2 protein